MALQAIEQLQLQCLGRFADTILGDTEWTERQKRAIRLQFMVLLKPGQCAGQLTTGPAGRHAGSGSS